jgi:AcrR family transcriptional regulator
MSSQFYIHDDDPPAKRAILRAAMKLFSERGLAATSIRDIAAQSGYTNPALYKHYESKEQLALTLFDLCHRRVWSRLDAALNRGTNFETKLDAYVGEWLELIDGDPEVLAFLSDSARVLWPKASATVKRHTLIGLARALAISAQRRAGRPAKSDTDVVAAAVQGTLSEFTRMLQVGVVDGPATRWKADLVTVLRRIAD